MPSKKIFWFLNWQNFHFFNSIFSKEAKLMYYMKFVVWNFKQNTGFVLKHFDQNNLWAIIFLMQNILFPTYVHLKNACYLYSACSNPLNPHTQRWPMWLASPLFNKLTFSDHIFIQNYRCFCNSLSFGWYYFSLSFVVLEIKQCCGP